MWINSHHASAQARSLGNTGRSSRYLRPFCRTVNTHSYSVSKGTWSIEFWQESQQYVFQLFVLFQKISIPLPHRVFCLELPHSRFASYLLSKHLASELRIRIKHIFTHYFDDECFPVILDFLDDRVTHHVKNMLFEEGNYSYFITLNYLFEFDQSTRTLG